MTFLEAAQELPGHACEPNALDAPIVVRLLARDEAGTDEVVDESTRRSPRSTDGVGDVTDRGLFTVGDEVHRDELSEGQLAPAQLVQRGKEELCREWGRVARSAHWPSLGGSHSMCVYATNAPIT
jgi:hypothetical protein